MSKKQTQIIPVGLIHLFGPDNVGKSTLPFTVSTEYFRPERFLLLDDDSGKGQPFAEQSGCQYENLMENASDMNEIQFHEHVLSLVRNLEDGSLDFLVFDNATRFFTSGHSWMVENFSRYRKIVRGSGAIIGAYQWKALREHHYPAFYNLLLQKAKIVFVITHEKEQTDSSGVKTGAMEPAADKSLRKGANVVIRLTTNKSGSPVPTGLVIKDITKFPPTRVLPPRIEECTWPQIVKYYYNPVGVSLNESQQPDEFEQHLIAGSLTPEQQRVHEFNRKMKLMKKLMKMSENMAEDVVAAYDPDGPPLPIQAGTIASSLEGQYPQLTKKDVVRIVSTAQESADEEEESE